MYIYIQSDHKLWTVGFYKPDGIFDPESDWPSTEEAAKRVHYLNGGKEEPKEYECSMCGYKSDMKHFKEWRTMCYQCYQGETEFKDDGML